MKLLISGGAGFIGSHATRRFARGNTVTVLDDLSRRGSQANLDWLRGEGEFRFIQQDIRDASTVLASVAECRPDVVLHLAAQVAVTTSVNDPRHDFEVNALGTFNVMEAVRQKAPEALVIYASTNKVYGGMEDIEVVLRNRRYQYANLPNGVSEAAPLDFHSPYGCSKGAGDQYVRDYARIYGLRTAVFRQSCIYGTRQFGVEDQGWIAWFTICSVLGRPITIFGDGFQARDVLWIDDLLDAFQAVIDRRDNMHGEVFNIGGGPANQISLIESLETLEQLLGRPIRWSYSDPRPGDQKVFVADTRRAREMLGWQPRVGPADGIERLFRWVSENKALFEQ